MKPTKVSAQTIDERGKPCPLPIIALARALKAHGEVELVADDPAVRADLLSYCEATGSTLVSLTAQGAVITARIRRKSG